jgi:hypothetical protein
VHRRHLENISGSGLGVLLSFQGVVALRGGQRCCGVSWEDVVTKPDPFTFHRLCRETKRYRDAHATLPTLRDLEALGFSKDVVDAAVKAGHLVELYVPMTNGALVKGYKIRT